MDESTKTLDEAQANGAVAEENLRQYRENLQKTAAHCLATLAALEAAAKPRPTVQELLAQARKADQIVKVLDERCVELVVARLAGPLPQRVASESPELQANPMGEQFVAKADHQELAFPYAAVSRQDRHRVVLGAKFWEVEAIEEDRYGRRKRCIRLIFAEN
jgi:hypothetical protein